jgi:hypothetical protein
VKVLVPMVLIIVHKMTKSLFDPSIFVFSLAIGLRMISC